MNADKNTHVENLRTEYREVCQTHHAVSDFRAKLLSLMPLASGAGIFLLLRKQSEPLDPIHIAAIGVFGFVITLGLFFHELRGILHCSGLIELGKSLEEELELDEGQFTLDYKYYNPKGNRLIVRKLVHEIIGPRGAAWIIYPSVCIAWLYVASVGLGLTIGRFLILLGLLSIVALFSVARWIWQLRNKDTGKAVRR
jgi:hypothetical protein